MEAIELVSWPCSFSPSGCKIFEEAHLNCIAVGNMLTVWWRLALMGIYASLTARHLTYIYCILFVLYLLF